MAMTENCTTSAFELAPVALRGSTHKWAWNDETARLHVLRVLVQSVASDNVGDANECKAGKGASIEPWLTTLPTLWQLERQLFIVSRGNRSDYMARATELLALLKQKGLAAVQAVDTHGSLAWMLDQPACTPRGNAKADALARLARVRLEPPKDVGSSGVRCRKCGSRDLDVVMRQTRAADEGMTAFVTCRACGHGW